jgi:hypothetical protein
MNENLYIDRKKENLKSADVKYDIIGKNLADLRRYAREELNWGRNEV